jgi:hypothetical protein
MGGGRVGGDWRSEANPANRDVLCVKLRRSFVVVA